MCGGVGVGGVTLGHTLASMISSGLKDEQRDAFQVSPLPPPLIIHPLDMTLCEVKYMFIQL